MKQRIYQFVFPAALAVVMMVVVSTLVLGNATPSFAAAKKKSVTVTSAVERSEAHIKQLQDALKITEAQQELWANLTKVMRENAQELDLFAKDRVEKSKTMNSVERFKLHCQFTETHLEQMKKFIPPFEALYSVMSDEQKKTTDTLFRTGRHGKHRIQ